MWKPYTVFCRCGKRQAGTAVILAILTVALVASLAAAVLADYGTAVASVSGRHDQAQARLLAMGAVDWARNILADDARTSSTDHGGEAWATRVPPTPVEEGEISGELEDLSGHFDLNSVVKEGKVDLYQAARYKRLLILLGVSADRAAALAAALVDWLDADDTVAGSGQSEVAQYGAASSARRPANAPLADVDELALVLGYDVRIMALLRPFVVALPVAAPLNVNTAPAEVLSAAIPGLEMDKARLLVNQRKQAAFKNLEDFLAALGRVDAPADASRLSVTSRYFQASVRAHYGEATSRFQVMLDRRNTWPEILWLKIQ
jgi:general secretion pathway protein K